MTPESGRGVRRSQRVLRDPGWALVFRAGEGASHRAIGGPRSFVQIIVQIDPRFSLKKRIPVFICGYFDTHLRELPGSSRILKSITVFKKKIATMISIKTFSGQIDNRFLFCNRVPIF